MSDQVPFPRVSDAENRHGAWWNLMTDGRPL